MTGPPAVAVSCSNLMDRVDSAHLDCISVNLALLLAQAGVLDVRTPFAHKWALETVADDTGCRSVDLPPRSQTRSIERLTGCTVRHREIGDLTAAVTTWRRELSEGRAVLVEGDAFHLPWVPYFQHEHMGHGFVVAGIDRGGDPLLHIVDPYDNNTQWGRAAPQTTTVKLGEIADGMRSGSWSIVVPSGPAEPCDRAEEVVRNCAAMTVGGPEVDQFLASSRGTSVEDLRRLTLTSWLVTRDRELHLAWLEEPPIGAVEPMVQEFARRFATEVVPRWRRLQESTYIALRRAEAGRAVPGVAGDALVEAVTAEVALAGSTTRIHDGERAAR